MPEDRFGDLGPQKPKRSAAERFAEEDRLRPEADDPSNRPEVPRPGNRYAWVVGIIILMVFGVVMLTRSVPDAGEGSLGPARGTLLRAFAAPSATGELDGDANVRQFSGGTDRAGSGPACRLRGEDVINLCELRAKPLVLTFVVTRGADCEPQVDRVERMRDEFPGVNFAAVVSGNDREDVERIVRQRRWRLPVAVDRDGAVVSMYGISICPTTIFARPGGRVRDVELGNLTEDQLRKRVEALVASSRRE